MENDDQPEDLEVANDFQINLYRGKARNAVNFKDSPGRTHILTTQRQES